MYLLRPLIAALFLCVVFCQSARAESVGVDDVVSASIDSPVTIDAILNDQLSGTLAEIEITVGPRDGTAHVNADLTITYRPAKNFRGIDELVYKTIENSG